MNGQLNFLQTPHRLSLPIFALGKFTGGGETLFDRILTSVAGMLTGDADLALALSGDGLLELSDEDELLSEQLSIGKNACTPLSDGETGLDLSGIVVDLLDVGELPEVIDTTFLITDSGDGLLALLDDLTDKDLLIEVFLLRDNISSLVFAISEDTSCKT